MPVLMIHIIGNQDQSRIWSCLTRSPAVFGPDLGAIQKSAIMQKLQHFAINDRFQTVGPTNDVSPYIMALDIFALTSRTVATFSNAAMDSSGSTAISGRIRNKRFKIGLLLNCCGEY